MKNMNLTMLALIAAVWSLCRSTVAQEPAVYRYEPRQMVNTRSFKLQFNSAARRAFVVDTALSAGVKINSFHFGNVGQYTGSNSEYHFQLTANADSVAVVRVKTIEFNAVNEKLQGATFTWPGDGVRLHSVVNEAALTPAEETYFPDPGWARGSSPLPNLWDWNLLNPPSDHFIVITYIEAVRLAEGTLFTADPAKILRTVKKILAETSKRTAADSMPDKTSLIGWDEGIESLLLPARSFLVKYEGNKPYPYRDTEGNVTVGIGHLVPTEKAFRELNLTPNGKQPSELTELTNLLTDGATGNSAAALYWQRLVSSDRRNELKINKKGEAPIYPAEWYDPDTNGNLGPRMTLSPDAVDFLFEKDVTAAVKGLRDIFPRFSSFPTPAQVALLDLQFNTGKVTLPSEWLDLKKSVNANPPQWSQAAQECHVGGIGEDRNAAVSNLFLEAASDRN